VFNQTPGTIALKNTENNYGVLLLKSNNGQDNDYDLSVLDPGEVVKSLGFESPAKTGRIIDWNEVLELYGGYIPGISSIYFLQPSGNEIKGTFVVNEIDPSFLLVTIEDKPSNTVIVSTVFPDGKTTVDAIVDPYKFNPEETFGGIPNIPPGTRYLILDDVNNSSNVGGIFSRPEFDEYDGPDAWKNLDGSDPVLPANSIIEWTGNVWEVLTPQWQVSGLPYDTSVVYPEGSIVLYDNLVYRALSAVTRAENRIDPRQNPKFQEIEVYFANLRTGIQYRLLEGQWLKSFEGEYASGNWRFDLDPL
jgi:hypothetical protein